MNCSKCGAVMEFDEDVGSGEDIWMCKCGNELTEDEADAMRDEEK